MIRAASVWVAERIGLKKAEHRKKNESRWKRRIERDIKRLRQKVNFLERKSKGELVLKKKRKLNELSEIYRVKRKGLKTAIEELKQRNLSKSAQLRRHEQRIEQFRQDRIFHFGQERCTRIQWRWGKIMYQMLKNLRWVTFGASGKSIIEILRISWEMLNTFQK